MSENSEINEDAQETIYNINWMEKLTTKYLNEYSIGPAFEHVGMEILERLGYTKIRKLTRGFDFYAEKNGKTYSIEVKGSSTGEDVVIRWSQIRKLFLSEIDILGHPILLFINVTGEWCMYQLLDGNWSAIM